MSSDVQGGRSVGRFRLLGFPVHIDLSFVVIIAILGFQPGSSLSSLALWIVIAALSVLLHELGHAVVARPVATDITITLAGLGGLTRYQPTARLTRGRSLAIALAGPFVGLAAGAGLLLLRQAVTPRPGGLAAEVIATGVWTTIGWSVFNLLPILPLDGGHAVMELLPGSPVVRLRRTAVVSIVAAVAVGVAGLALGRVFFAVFAAFLVLTNAAALRRPSTSAPQGAPAPDGAPAVDGAPPRQPDAVRAVVQHLWDRQPGAALTLLQSLPEGTVTDLALHGAVLAATGDPAQGFALLHQERARRPGDENVLALLVLAHVLRGEYDDALAVIAEPSGAATPLGIVRRAQDDAFAAGSFVAAARIGDVACDRLMAIGQQGDAAALAFGSARAWARAGEAQQGLMALRHAVDAGFSDLAALDREPDLAAVRAEAGYERVREVVRLAAAPG